MKAFLCLSLCLTSCVPVPVYKELQKKISASQKERNDLRKQLNQCEEQNKNLTGKLNEKPLPVRQPIDQVELEAIKKQALEEVKKKYNDKQK